MKIYKIKASHMFNGAYSTITVCKVSGKKRIAEAIRECVAIEAGYWEALGYNVRIDGTFVVSKKDGKMRHAHFFSSEF